MPFFDLPLELREQIYEEMLDFHMDFTFINIGDMDIHIRLKNKSEQEKQTRLAPPRSTISWLRSRVKEFFENPEPIQKSLKANRPHISYPLERYTGNLDPCPLVYESSPLPLSLLLVSKEFSEELRRVYDKIFSRRNAFVETVLYGDDVYTKRFVNQLPRELQPHEFELLERSRFVFDGVIQDTLLTMEQLPDWLVPHVKSMFWTLKMLTFTKQKQWCATSLEYIMEQEQYQIFHPNKIAIHVRSEISDFLDKRKQNGADIENPFGLNMALDILTEHKAHCVELVESGPWDSGLEKELCDFSESLKIQFACVIRRIPEGELTQRGVFRSFTAEGKPRQEGIVFELRRASDVYLEIN